MTSPFTQADIQRWRTMAGQGKGDTHFSRLLPTKQNVGITRVTHTHRAAGSKF